MCPSVVVVYVVQPFNKNTAFAVCCNSSNSIFRECLLKFILVILDLHEINYDSLFTWFTFVEAIEWLSILFGSISFDVPSFGFSFIPSTLFL